MLLLRIAALPFLLLLMAEADQVTDQMDESKTAQFKKLPPPNFGLIDCAGRSDCASKGACLLCEWPAQCEYGNTVSVKCHTNQTCKQSNSMSRETVCQFCYQSASYEHICDSTAFVGNVSVLSVWPVRTQCTVRDHVICMGSRSFYKMVRPDWTSGHKWSTAFTLSVTLGGFGADRFYLGLWKSGIGKLFSFGGLGVWTLIDVMLIGCGYVGPADGSLYIY